MTKNKNYNKSFWRNPFLWFLSICGLIGLSIWLFGEVPDPRESHTKDKIYYIGIDSTLTNWTIEWTSSDNSVRRLKLLSPQQDALIEIFAFQGDLDYDKFNRIDTLLYGKQFPHPYSTTVITEYGRQVRRSEYKRLSTEGYVIYTTIDLLWHEAKKDYVYVIVSTTFRQFDPNVQAVKSSLGFYPPRLTIIGKTTKLVLTLADSWEIGFALLTWIAATLWGLSYVAKILDKKWKPAKYIVGIGLIALTVIAHIVFNINWIGTLLLFTIILVVIGVATALLSGAWKFEE